MFTSVTFKAVTFSLSIVKLRYYSTPFVGKQAGIRYGKLRIFLSDFVGTLDVVFSPLPCPQSAAEIYKIATFIFRRLCYTM